MEDGSVIDDTLRGIARLIAEYKDAAIIANMLAELSPSTVADQAALSMSDVLALASELPSSPELPHCYLSSKSYFNLKAQELAVGANSGDGMVCGLPAVLVNGSNSDVAGSYVLSVGYANEALGYAQVTERDAAI